MTYLQLAMSDYTAKCLQIKDFVVAQLSGLQQKPIGELLMILENVASETNGLHGKISLLIALKLLPVSEYATRPLCYDDKVRLAKLRQQSTTLITREGES